MENYICVTCGAQFAATASAPARCPICEDDRQYIGANGQQWTTLTKMRATHHNTFADADTNLIGVRTEPGFAIGQQATLIRTPHGNVLWETTSYIDDETIARVRELGGIAAITSSHPHLYGSIVEWSHAFDAPIYVHADNRPWSMRPDDAFVYWEGESHEILPELTVIRCGGHFPGSMALHWADGADGHGALFTGDTIMVVSDTSWVSFMYSYPNFIPMNAANVMGIVDAVEPYAFERLYSSWPGKVVAEDAKNAVRRSAERYIAHIRD